MNDSCEWIFMSYNIVFEEYLREMKASEGRFSSSLSIQFFKASQYQPWWLLAETQNIVLIFLHLFCNLSTFFSSAKKREKNGWEWSVIISLQWSLTFSEMLCPQLSGYPSITPWEQGLDSQSMKLTLLLSRQVKDFQQSGGHNFKIFIGDLGRGRGWGFRELLNTYYFPARSRIFNGNSE